MVIRTSSNKLASCPLNSVDFDAATSKMVRFCSTFLKLIPADWRDTSTGAAGGAFCFSKWRNQSRPTYATAVTPPRTHATSADPRAYLPPSLPHTCLVLAKDLQLYMRGI